MSMGDCVGMLAGNFLSEEAWAGWREGKGEDDWGVEGVEGVEGEDQGSRGVEENIQWVLII